MIDLRSKLQKTREAFSVPFKRLLPRGGGLSREDEKAIEELLIASDLGVEASERIIEDLKRSKGDNHLDFLKRTFVDLLYEPVQREEYVTYPRAAMVVGVNGVGKTTCAAKLARFYQNEGKRVLLAACDTFRAAADSQLSIWAGRIGAQIVTHKSGGDPAAVAFDACKAAKSRGIDCVVLDTAGRMHTRGRLMEELKKIRRVCEKILGQEAVEVLLTIDATLGQNSLAQAREFVKCLGVKGLLLAKLDSTSKGGIVIAIRQTLGLPVRFIGVGEGVEDFSEFSPEAFVDAVLS